MCAVALAPRGSETGRCLSVGDYVRGRRPPAGRPPPRHANVAYAPLFGLAALRRKLGLVREKS